MRVTSTFKVPSGAALLAAERTGDGPALICLHAGVADRRMYAAQMRGLGDDFTVLSYDRRGFGQTRTPDEPFSHVDDLAAVMDAAGLEAAILLGCSQGGRIAIDLALAFPHRVRALILIASAVTGAPSEPLPDDIQPLADALEAAEDADDLIQVNRLEAHIWLDGPRAAEGRVFGPLRSLFLDMNGLALKHAPLTQEREPGDAYARLSALGVPTLLMHGTLDFPYIASRHAHMAAVIPDARSVTCEGSAHLPSMENPDAVNARIVAFCRDRGLI